MAGKVYLIGAGPGAADLITVRGMRLLQQADVVLFDALVQPEMLGYCTQAERVDVGKRCNLASTQQRFINKMLVDAANKHALVVRLKGGDPMLFGRAQEELNALDEAGIEYEIVPGVTAALAASAGAGVSLTSRGVARNVLFATARVGQGEDPTDWVRPVVAADTAVLYMGVKQAAEVAAALLAGGMPASTPLLIVENAGLPNAREWPLTLADLPVAANWQLAGPAILMIGEVYRAKLALDKPIAMGRQA
ncbi:uroporphyrinogen-III C-methyltransferase [Chitinimonas sp. BJB300]|uniref:uroporphyrinogen-III C-methyltransferase n=1 Tax=Chitinimonas sp. BJB300 TaxID=1559339 RepID=UPI000C0E83EE|nr:uroporphyrinogen-III C-methyltransferase [Chitinimonas sp. BJB300]PHV10513.1 uroporphyrinogen-III C-methyltransferase [Chitinimonas sp. BJB300]TSJ90760.1 uroporphyrinogen-III C-methyltransferase [Chitinimonas sp. BJB300]